MSRRMLRDWTDSKKVDMLSAEAERLFTRLIMKADDYGGYHAEPALLIAFLFPYKTKKIKEADIERWLTECEEAALLVTFDHDEKRYLHIFEFGQRLDKAKAKFPFPPQLIKKQDRSESVRFAPKSSESIKSSTDSTAELEVERNSEIEKKNTPTGVDEAAASSPSPELLYKDVKKTKGWITDFIRKHKPTFINPYLDLWNIFASERKLPQVRDLTLSRKRKFHVRIRENGFDFIELLRKAAQSEFVLTSNWFTFDWILENDKNFLKVLEGNYDNKTTTSKQGKPSQKPVLGFNDELKYLFERLQEGTLEARTISPEIYVKLETRDMVPLGRASQMQGATTEEKMQNAVVEFLKAQTKEVANVC
jgi:hypothetical protein